MNQRLLNRKFGLITGCACLLITAWQYLVHGHLQVWLLIIGNLLLIFAIILPLALNPFRLAWDRVGNILAAINTTVILFLLYFFIITPVAFMMRLMKKSSLDLKFKPDERSYWKPVKENGEHSMKQQF